MESSLSLSSHHPLSTPVLPSPKRGPGRPPKAKPGPTQPTLAAHEAVPQQLAVRKRGRPPKLAQSQPNQVPVQARPDENRRRPGRPPKQVVPFGQPVPSAAEADDVRVRRPAGRPPKLSVVRPAAAGGSGRPRGRPKKSALGPASRPIAKRGRGRPKGIVGGGGGGGGGGVVAGKRRGRPPKGSAAPRVKPKRVSQSGKPLGRPRKDASAARSLKFEQVKANEELTTKLELIQVKVREVVGIVRPYVADANEALVALQELEEVAMTTPPTGPPAAPEPENGPGDLGLTAPSTEPAPAPAPAPVSGPYYGVPGTFSVNLPALDATEPLHMGGPGISIEGQQAAMSWIPTGGAQS